MDIYIHIDGLNINKKDFAKSRLNPLLYRFYKDLIKTYPNYPVVLNVQTDDDLLDSNDILAKAKIFKQPRKEN